MMVQKLLTKFLHIQIFVRTWQIKYENLKDVYAISVKQCLRLLLIEEIHKKKN